MSLFAAANKRASVENPSTNLARPAQWLVDVFGGGQSDAGIDITESSSLKFSAVWNAVTIYSSTIATLPVKVFERDVTGNKTERPDHPSAPLVGTRPNDLMTGSTFKQAGTAHNLLWGNFYAAISRNGRGDPRELTLLDPSRTKPEKRSDRIVIVTRLDDGSEIQFELRDVIHVPGLSTDGIIGLSVITHARNTIGLGLATEKFGSRFFSNGAALSGVLEHPGKFRDEEAKRNFRKSWEEVYSGTDKAMKTAVLEHGMKYSRIGIPPEDAQFLETRKFSVNEIARWFNLPPHMLKDLDRATFSNIEQQAIEYVVHSLRPWLVKWEEEFERKLLTEEQKRSGRWEIRFNTNALLRGDSKAQADFIDKMIKNGVYALNDGLRFLGMNSVDGGDRRFIQRDRMPLDRIDEFVDKTVERNGTQNSRLYGKEVTNGQN